MGSDDAPGDLVTVVVTVRNEEAHLPRLLDNLLLQEGPFEVVLVESESRDRTRAIADEYARRHPERLRVLSHPGSRGIGRNVGAAHARGPWIAFTDGDCFPDSHWLSALRAAAPTAPVLAGRTVTVGKPQYGNLERVELFQSGFDVTYPTANLAYRRELFDRLGGFDPRFITAEDIDLNLRAVRAGASIRYVPGAVVYHHLRATPIRFLYQAFWNGYGRKQLTEKHGSLWGRYRIRRLLAGQRSVIAWARLVGALGGYSARVVTGRGRRLGPGTPSAPSFGA
ncbi:MAG TPA: glycosyltransferase [Thermoplasmata archaeon]|nr:glycosyltransferase [Thermoplasmata archaeon]